MSSALKIFLNSEETSNQLHDMKPNIKENPRNRKDPKGRKKNYIEEVCQERFETIERVFAWEDKFRKLVTRYEVKSIHHYAQNLRYERKMSMICRKNTWRTN